MCALITRALFCAAAARAAATSHVVDNFTSTEGMFTLTSQVPPVSTTEVSSTNAGVRLDYSSHHLEMYCPVPLTVRGTQALVSFAPLAFKLFYAARQNAVLRRSSF